MEYTKGEWKVEGDCYIVAGEEHKHSLICDLATANNDYEANAQLIASAPDLYRACKRAEQMLQYPQALSNEAKNYELEDLRKALAKAEGK